TSPEQDASTNDTGEHTGDGETALRHPRHDSHGHPDDQPHPNKTPPRTTPASTPATVRPPYGIPVTTATAALTQTRRFHERHRRADL
ncbi:hypothetical protein ACIRP7_40705, partial [Streptomyces sp. NPDC102270]|uniref:hypothetical protein n=1 Tax=Streptomyces sp. NPDC102270 TaxID=3366150 RepID=UPI0038034376